MCLRACLPVLLFWALPAIAQPTITNGPMAFGEIVRVDDRPYAVVTRWGASTRDGRRASIEVGAPGERGRAVWTGGAAITDAATNGRSILVAMIGGGGSIGVVLVPLEGGRPARGREQSVRRLAGSDRSPIGVTVTAHGEGYTVFWQEASNESPNALYQTFAVDVGANGELSEPRALPQVQWPIAAAIFDGQRYLLALYYATGSPTGTRLCAVHVAQDRPSEHPWWASRPGMITEVQLHLSAAGRVHAVYRGGDEGRALLSVDVTEGQWGREAQAPAEHGPIPEGEIFGARVDGERVRPDRASLR
ncbi:MAG: hypothetical protein K8H88_21135 [Sandaracinaceae bacterium]|nr:hypothetical protein [Sandaracinaceae bacterium]